VLLFCKLFFLKQEKKERTNQKKTNRKIQR